jgi:dTDP-4-dehydrorhamnose reductase
MGREMVWLAGCGGMLGTEVASALRKRDIPFYGTDLEVDITKIDTVANFTASKTITWIINCAAYTAVDDAEDNRDLAYRLNAVGPGNLAATAERIGATLIHVSTDYVFSGNAVVPYEVDDQPDPQGVYGATKLAGESIVQAETRRFFIVRSAWLFGKNGKNFVSTMINLMQSRNELIVVNDQQGSPTYAADLAHALTEFVVRRSENYGIYHYTNSGSASWHEFACAIYSRSKELGIVENQCSILPISSVKYPTKARRPSYSVLSSIKIENELQLSIPEWSDALARYLQNDVPNRTLTRKQNG